MSRPHLGPQRLTPELLLRAYAAGIFPMAQSRSDRHVFWIDPQTRGVLPLDRFHVPKSLKKIIRRGIFEIRIDTAFEQVINFCAQPFKNRSDTWINPEIMRAYTELHYRGFVHSVETWIENRLVGGLYGVALGSAFFGESMFSRVTDASKVALVYLVEQLKAGGFRLLDTQFVTDHLRRFGAVEVPCRVYLEKLEDALKHTASFCWERAPEEITAGLENLFRQSRTAPSA